MHFILNMRTFNDQCLNKFYDSTALQFDIPHWTTTNSGELMNMGSKFGWFRLPYKLKGVSFSILYGCINKNRLPAPVAQKPLRWLIWELVPVWITQHRCVLL